MFNACTVSWWESLCNQYKQQFWKPLLILEMGLSLVKPSLFHRFISECCFIPLHFILFNSSLLSLPQWLIMVMTSVVSDNTFLPNLISSMKNSSVFAFLKNIFTENANKMQAVSHNQQLLDTLKCFLLIQYITLVYVLLNFTNTIWLLFSIISPPSFQSFIPCLNTACQFLLLFQTTNK